VKKLAIVAVLIIMVVAFVGPAYQDKEIQRRVATSLSAGFAAEAKVAEYVQAHGKPPARATDVALGKPGNAPDLGDLRLEPGGKIRLVLAGPNLFAAPTLEGKAILLTPVIEAGKVARWQCDGGDVPQKYLPAACRR
jgi:Pilin (bacterial filament)